MLLRTLKKEGEKENKVLLDCTIIILLYRSLRERELNNTREKYHVESNFDHVFVENVINRSHCTYISCFHISRI